MPIGRIRMPHTPNPSAGEAYDYVNKRRGRPILFQVTDPVGQPLWPVMLALHTSPQSLGERMTKSKSVAMTFGGFVEFHWPEELSGLSASMTTGAFMGANVGLVSGSDGRGQQNNGVDTRTGATGRKGTMAWERQEDLLDLFRNNGAVYNGVGQPVLRGQIMCIYDRGIFIGHFTTFSVKESDEKAFSFELDWEFKVERTIYLFPSVDVFQSSPRSGVTVNDVVDPDVDRSVFDREPEPNVDENTPSADPVEPATEEEATALAADIVSFFTPDNPIPDEDGT